MVDDGCRITVCVCVRVQVYLCAYEDIQEEEAYEKIRRLNVRRNSYPHPISDFSSLFLLGILRNHMCTAYRESITGQKYGTARKVVLHVSLRGNLISR